VLKPSERDPSVTNFCAELLAEGRPAAGVFNVVHGDKVAVDRLLEHPDVGAVSLRRLDADRPLHLRDRHPHGKRVQALGGAKNHMIVLPDADMELAADAASAPATARPASAAWPSRWWSRSAAPPTSSSPRCSSASRLKVGDGLDPARRWARSSPAQHRDKVAGYVDAGVPRARAPGPTAARLKVAPGHEAASSSARRLFDRVSPAMSIYQDEIFGPVLGVPASRPTTRRSRWSTRNPYANGVAIFTNDGGAARKFQHEVQVGMVGINVPIPVPMAYYSFGGWKQSLFGDLHIYGPTACASTPATRSSPRRWPDPRFRGVDLGFPA
jgi:malonate-semialdehyde dehydrogenase (acetylating)/methylmalonate-semialdehyde dehydrogenase